MEAWKVLNSPSIFTSIYVCNADILSTSVGNLNLSPSKRV